MSRGKFRQSICAIGKGYCVNKMSKRFTTKFDSTFYVPTYALSIFSPKVIAKKKYRNLSVKSCSPLSRKNVGEIEPWLLDFMTLARKASTK